MQEEQGMLADNTMSIASRRGYPPGHHKVQVMHACDGTASPGTRWKRVSQAAAAVLLSALVVYAQSATAALEPIERAGLQADITQTYDLLRKYHPNLTAHTGRKDFEALRDRLLASTRERATKEDAYVALAELVGAVCDEHTWIQLDWDIESEWPEGWPWYDRPLIVDGGRLYVENPETGLKDEVISVDDVSGSDIAESLALRSSSNGCLGEGTLMVNEALSVYGNIVAAMIGVSSHYVLKTRPAGTQGVWTQAIEGADRYTAAANSLRALGSETRRFETTMEAAGFGGRDLRAAVRGAELDYRFSPDRDLAYLGIGSFEEGNVADKGVDLVMRDIIKKNPDALIIDLVDNPGGTVNTVQTVLAFLLPRSHRLFSRVYVRDVTKERPPNFEYFDETAEEARKAEVRFFRKIKPKGGKRSVPMARRSFGKPDYKGRIYVLVSPASRSGATSLAANLKRLRKATIVGSLSATDTVTYCSRASGAFTLQHTGFTLYIPDLCYSGPENRFNEEHSLVPDIEIRPLDVKLADYRSEVLDAVLDDLRRAVTH